GQLSGAAAEVEEPAGAVEAEAPDHVIDECRGVVGSKTRVVPGCRGEQLPRATVSVHDQSIGPLGAGLGSVISPAWDEIWTDSCLVSTGLAGRSGLVGWSWLGSLDEPVWRVSANWPVGADVDQLGLTARPYFRCRARNRVPSSPSNCGTPVCPPILACSVFSLEPKASNRSRASCRSFPSSSHCSRTSSGMVTCRASSNMVRGTKLPANRRAAEMR